MSSDRRIWSPHEKTNIVLKILREESTLIEISKNRQHAYRFRQKGRRH